MAEEKPWADGFKKADGAFSRKLDRVRSTQTGLPAAGGQVREWNSGVFTARTLDEPTKPSTTSSTQSFPIIPNNPNRSQFNLPAQPVPSPYELAPEYTAAQGPYKPAPVTNQPAQAPYQPAQAPYQPAQAPYQPAHSHQTPQAPYQPAQAAYQPAQPHQPPQAPYQPAQAAYQPAQPHQPPQAPYQPAQPHQQPLATYQEPQEPYAAQAPFPSPSRSYEQGPAFFQPDPLPRPHTTLAPVQIPMTATNPTSPATQTIPATQATPVMPATPNTTSPAIPAPEPGNSGHSSVQGSDSLDSTGVFDSQTQTYSFKYMVSRIQQELIRSQYFQRQAAVFVVAIDILQAAPLTWGQKEKDRVLQAVSLSLINSVRPVDLVGRFAEERFFILCPEITVDSSQELAETLRAACSATKVKHEWHDIPLSVSIGIAVSSDQVTDIETLLAEADVGADLAMQNGGNQYYCY